MSLPAFVGPDSPDLLGMGGASPVPVAVFLRTSTRDCKTPRCRCRASSTTAARCCRPGS